VPTLVIHGALDTVIRPDIGKLVHDTIPDSEHVPLAHAGHFPSLTAHDEVNRRLAGFVSHCLRQDGTATVVPAVQ